MHHWDTGSPPPQASALKRCKSAPKLSASPACEKEIHAGEDLQLLIRINKEGGIVHALQQEVVQEIIAR